VLNLIAIHAPDLVVVTGNGHGELDDLLRQARRQVSGYQFAPPGIDVCASALGGMAGCVGAARMALMSGSDHG